MVKQVHLQDGRNETILRFTTPFELLRKLKKKGWDSEKGDLLLLADTASEIITEQDVPGGDELKLVLRRRPTAAYDQPTQTLEALKDIALAVMIQDDMEADSISSKDQRPEESVFKTDCYNYYFQCKDTSLPPRLTCMISGLELESDCIMAAPLVCGIFPALSNLDYSAADVWTVRNALIWAVPFDMAWHRLEIAIFPDRVAGRLTMRVLTDETLNTRLMDEDNMPGSQDRTYNFHRFKDFDGAELLVSESAMPDRRLLLHHAWCAVTYQKARGHLREGISVHPDDFAVQSDCDKRAAVCTLLQTLENGVGWPT